MTFSKAKKPLFLFICLFLLQCQKGISEESYRYQLAVTSIYSTEDLPYLEEWIEFHRLVGVEHFYLFNNLSSDLYREVLDPYIDNGIVEIIDWPYPSDDRETWHLIYSSAYSKGVELATGEAKWLAVIDTDEFLFGVEEDDLLVLLKEYEKFGGVAVNWQMYGTSNVEKLDENQLMIEQLVLKGDKDFFRNQYIKSIVRPERVSHYEDGHDATYHKPFYQVNEHKTRFEGMKSDTVSIDKLRINHYWSRDEDFFYNIKVERSKKVGIKPEKSIYINNEINREEDPCILRFVPALRSRIFGCL